MKQTTEQMTKEELITALRSRGVELLIGGCGCCGSPWIEVKLDGEYIYKSEEDNIEMFKPWWDRE